jgi:hypothetical protein
MKTIVSIQEISEFDIKPQEALEKWRSLVKEEIETRWANRSSWIETTCPVCSSDQQLPAFESYGIPYVECKDCKSLYASLRPGESDLWEWYRESAPANFWRKELLPDSEEARFEKITTPRSNWILDSIAEYNPSAKHLVDVSHNGRLLVDVLVKSNKKLQKVDSAGITADLDGQSVDNITVNPTKTEELTKLGLGEVDVIIAVDTFDRCVNIVNLVKTFDKMLAPGGLVFATAAVSSGFEIQALWDQSPTVIPPDKLNLPSVEGLKKLFLGTNFEILELSTPGMFDIEVVSRVIKSHPSTEWPRVLKMLINNLGTEGHRSIIELLQSLSLTSFARIVVRKKAIKNV